jgi:hypothetical protein
MMRSSAVATLSPRQVKDQRVWIYNGKKLSDMDKQ